MALNGSTSALSESHAPPKPVRLGGKSPSPHNPQPPMALTVFPKSARLRSNSPIPHKPHPPTVTSSLQYSTLKDETPIPDVPHTSSTQIETLSYVQLRSESLTSVTPLSPTDPNPSSSFPSLAWWFSCCRCHWLRGLI